MFLAYAFDWGFVAAQLPDLLKGLRLTVEVSIIGVLASLLIGVVGATLCVLGGPFFRRLVGIYVEIIRNTPLLVQIFFIYFVLPQIGIKLSGFVVACSSLAIWGGAYNIENFRAGFEAVERGYQEAAHALGLNRLQTFLVVDLPLGFRTALPSTTNTVVSVLKCSSFMVAIGFQELTDTAVGIVDQTFRVFEMFLVLGVAYLGLVSILSAIMMFTERQLKLRDVR